MKVSISNIIPQSIVPEKKNVSKEFFWNAIVCFSIWGIWMRELCIRLLLVIDFRGGRWAFQDIFQDRGNDFP